MKAWSGLFVPALLLSFPLQGQTSQETAIPPTGRLKDFQAEALARKAISSTDGEFQKKVLARLQAHHFMSSRAKEREFVLFVMGVLEDRFESPTKAATTLKKLERTWPRSAFMGEAHVIIAAADVEGRRFTTAVRRFRKALVADIPVESKRRAQELILWSLAEEGRAAEGSEIIRSLYPLGNSKPSEKGLVGIMEALCVMKDKDGADSTRLSYTTLYPKGPFTARLNLDWAVLLGNLGEIKASAESFRQLIIEQPNTRESDEARLALATLLAEGKLPKSQLSLFGDPAVLLADIKKTGTDDTRTRRLLLTQMRLNVNSGQWKQALDIANQLKGMAISDSESMTLSQLRADAFRGYAADLLPKAQVDPLLPYVDKDSVRCLGQEQRKLLLKLLMEKGLPEAARAVVDQAPSSEQSELRHFALGHAIPEGDAPGVLSLMPPKGETPLESLKRAQAEIIRGDWPKVRAALLKAKPGPERINAVLALLRRPPETGEGSEARLREAETWLSRTSEKGSDKEPLAILVADLRVKIGRWKEALALYPVKPQPENKGWVALMRATCQIKLGNKDAAKATLKTNVDEPAFRMERRTLGKQVGME